MCDPDIKFVRLAFHEKTDCGNSREINGVTYSKFCGLLIT